MKTIRLALILAAACTWAAAEDPVVGNERAEVIKRIGKPAGKMTMRGHETLVYERGVVELTSGVVTRVKLVTPAPTVSNVSLSIRMKLPSVRSTSF